MTDYHRIRPATKADLDYIIPSWMHTWEQSPEMNFPGMIRGQYYRHAHLILDELLPRCSDNGSLLVACEPDAPYIIKGYLAAEVFDTPPIAYLHWVQVKKKYWRQGVATQLIETLKRDFNILPDQNILYTFGSKAMRRRELAKKACERHNLVYWPWYKYTTQPYGWETGREVPCPHCGGAL